MKRKYTFTGKHCKLNLYPNIQKVNDIDPEKYRTELFTQTGFKKYKPGNSLEDQVSETIPVICSHFGCKKELSLRQQLAGNRCEDHPKEIKTYSNPLL